MSNKTLEFTLTIEVDESVVQQVKDAVIRAEGDQPPLADRLMSLVEEKLSAMGLSDEVTMKLDYRRTIDRRPSLQGGLSRQEWSNKDDQPGPVLPE